MLEEKLSKEIPRRFENGVLNSFEKWNWWLSHLARAHTRARRLEGNRAEFHEELGAAILYPTVHYDKVFRGNLGSPASDLQAIRIVEAKERYERKIKREYERVSTWKDILSQCATERERFILVRHFQKGKSLDRSVLLPVVSSLDKTLAALEARITKERNARATTESEEYKRQTESFRKTAEPVEVTDKQQYSIKGKFVYMAPEEYEDHLQQESEMVMTLEKPNVGYEERRRARRERLLS